MLQTDSPWTSINDFTAPVPTEPNGDTVIRFAPVRPDGVANWLPTVPGKGWFVILRPYRPLEPWFGKTWRPSEIRRVD